MMLVTKTIEFVKLFFKAISCIYIFMIDLDSFDNKFQLNEHIVLFDRDFKQGVRQS